MGVKMKFNPPKKRTKIVVVILLVCDLSRGRLKIKCSPWWLFLFRTAFFFLPTKLCCYQKSDQIERGGRGEMDGFAIPLSTAGDKARFDPIRWTLLGFKEEWEEGGRRRRL
jgi:hypothetical protein